MQNCEFYIQKVSVTTLSLMLTLTSTEQVILSFVAEYNSVYTQISSNKIFAQVEILNGIQIRSGGKLFFIEGEINNSTQYSRNLGVFNFGETYTQPPFTFTVSEHVNDFLLPQISSNISSVAFYPFISAHITDESTHSTYHKEEDQIVVFVDENYNLEGLVLTNPFYSAQNMSFNPAQQNNNYGELIFHFEDSSHPH